MTIEKLEEATKLKKEIKETEHMVNSLQNGYINSIRAVGYAGGKEDDAVVKFSSGDKLHKVILDYFESKLDFLEKQFGQI